MKIAVASDHAGFELKQAIAEKLSACGHEVSDFGTDSAASVDYPLFAEPAARAVSDGTAERGIFVCGSGVGVCMVANKVEGVRAVNAHDPQEAGMSRLHNDANVLCLSGKRFELMQAVQIVHAFLNTDFEGGRHERRVDQIAALDGARATSA